MKFFCCDYHEGAHPEIMRRMIETNMEQTVGYGEDEHCGRARQLILEACQASDADVHFLVGGTQTNATVIAAALRPYQGVITADSGHINVHETGAVEASGHKVLAQPSIEGKLTAAQIRAYAQWHKQNGAREHIVMPKMVYISNPTEYGTLYTKKELEAISRVCREEDFYLYLDGARLGYGLCAESNDLTLPDIFRLCDVFYIGGTKCGALFGEAVVIKNESLKKDFRYMIKQMGGMLAKGRLLGIQFETLFEDGLYMKICRHAIVQAMRIKGALAAKGVSFLIDSPTNQQFPILEDPVIEKIGQKYGYEEDQRIDESHCAIRLCTSWATKTEDVDDLIEDLNQWL